MVTQNKSESTLTPAQKAFVAYRRRVNPDSWFSVPNGTSHRVAENLVKKGVLVKKLDKVSLSDLYHFADTLPQAPKSIPAAPKVDISDLVRAAKEFCWDCAGKGSFADVDGYIKTCPKCEGLGSVILENEVQLDAPKFAVGQRVHIPASLLGWQGEIMHIVISGITERGYEIEFDNGNKVEVTDLTLLRPCDCPPEKPKSIPAAMPAPATLYPFTTPPQRVDDGSRRIRQAGLGSDERSAAGNLTSVNRLWQALQATLADAAAQLPAELVDELKADFDYDTMSVNTWERNAALAERLKELMQTAWCDIHERHCAGVITEWIDDETPLNVCAVHRANRQRINAETSNVGELNHIFYPTQEVIHTTEWGSTPARVTRSMFTDAWYYDIVLPGKTLYNVRPADLTPVGAAPAVPAQRFAVGDAVTISDSHDLWYGRQGKISATGWQQAGASIFPVYHVTHASGYTYAYIPQGMLHHTPILLTDPRPTADDYCQRAHALENQCWVHIGENFRNEAEADYWKQQTAWFAHVVNFLSTPPADPQPVPVPSDPPYGDGDEVFVEGLKGAYRIVGEGVWNDSAWWFTAEQDRQRVFVPASSLSIFSPSAARWVGFYAYMRTAPIAEHTRSRFAGIEKVAVVKMQGGFATVRRGKLHNTLHYRNLTLTDERVPAEEMAAEVPTFESRVERQHREVVAERAARQAVQA